MILNIKHQTTYNFYSSVPRLVQSLKLYPSNCKNQKVIKWNISTSMGQLCKSHQDALGHTIYNIYSESIIGEQTIVSEGKINTKDFNGVMHGLMDKVNPFCFLRFTHLTKPGEKLIKLSKKIKKKNDQIQFCHDLNTLVSESINFKTGITNNQTTAEESLNLKPTVEAESYIFLHNFVARKTNTISFEVEIDVPKQSLNRSISTVPVNLSKSYQGQIHLLKLQGRSFSGATEKFIGQLLEVFNKK